MKLRNKVCIVTGGGQGIGEATAKLMAKEGANVVVADINEETGKAVVEKINSEGHKALFVKTDVSSSEQVKRLMSVTKETFGSLNVLFNNAGVHETGLTDRSISYELEEDIWDKVLSINLKGVWMCSKYTAPWLLRYRWWNFALASSSVAVIIF
jgi:NAD(P)-dependent dehydrogenase (short-subunit alcohol dehydrogenase family)